MRLLSYLVHRGAASHALIVFAASVGALCFLSTQVLAETSSSAVGFLQQTAQEKDKQGEVKVSAGESKLGDEINKAATVDAKLTIAEEFIKKYPKSSLRQQVVEYLSGQIITVTDPSQKIAMAERYLTLFPDAGESVHVALALVEAYIAAQRFDDAFRAGAAWLTKAPDDVRVLAQLAFHGIEQARRKNPKFAQQAQQYLAKAITVFEAGSRPATVSEAQFDDYKKAWLPQLYQVQSFLALSAGNTAEAVARAQKAAALNQTDPINYFLIGAAKDEEYKKLVGQHRNLPDGPQKTELTNKINTQLDEIIDYYARTVAFSESSPQHKGLHDQVLLDITAYYKFRHQGSTDGMQQLIDKYKKQPSP